MSCRIFGVKKEPIEHRPWVHHKLFLKKDHFDARYNAALYCINLIKKEMNTTLLMHSFELTKLILLEYNKFCMNKDDQFFVTIFSSGINFKYHILIYN
jgi:hypothetical protein